MVVVNLDLQLPMELVPITSDLVSLNPTQGEVYNITVKSLLFMRYQFSWFSWVD